MRNVITFVLGGGRGSRLYPLTKYRSKPAVPLAGKYRLIDIPLSNCLNSGLNRIYVLTQFMSVSLHRHIRQTYRFDHFSGGFVELLAAQHFIDIAMEALEGSNGHLTDISALLKQGLVARVDLYRTEVTVARRERDLAAAETNAVRRSEHLSSLIFPDRIVTVRARGEVPPPEEERSVDEWMSIAEERSPEIILSRHSLELARTGVEAARAERWPRLGLFGAYGAKDERFSFDDEDRYWNAGAALTRPLYMGGRTILGIDVARDTERQADNDIVQVRRFIRRGIVDADAGTTLALRQYAAAVKAVTAAEENLRVTRLKYNQGLISNIDVIDALLSFSRSRFDRIQALKDFHINRARLMRLAGTIEELP